MFYKLIFRKINATDAICNLKDYIAKKTFIFDESDKTLEFSWDCYNSR